MIGNEEFRETVYEILSPEIVPFDVEYWIQNPTETRDVLRNVFSPIDTVGIKIYDIFQAANVLGVDGKTVSKCFDSAGSKGLNGYRIPGTQDRRIPREYLITFIERNGISSGLLARSVGRDRNHLGLTKESLERYLEESDENKCDGKLFRDFRKVVCDNLPKEFREVGKKDESSYLHFPDHVREALDYSFNSIGEVYCEEDVSNILPEDSWDVNRLYQSKKLKGYEFPFSEGFRTFPGFIARFIRDNALPLDQLVFPGKKLPEREEKPDETIGPMLI